MVLAALDVRAARHFALGDPTRLAIVDQLTAADRSPVELRHLTGIESNLLAHHLDVLESVGMITRKRSSGDQRRRYVQLQRHALHELDVGVRLDRQPALFVCTQNSARSQLAAALWVTMTEQPAESAGTHPAPRVHPGAVQAAHRAGLDLNNAQPRQLADVPVRPRLVITVCDQAHEELDPGFSRFHWSIDDPVANPTKSTFDATVVELRERIESVVGAA